MNFPRWRDNAMALLQQQRVQQQRHQQGVLQVDANHIQVDIPPPMGPARIAMVRQQAQLEAQLAEPILPRAVRTERITVEEEEDILSFNGGQKVGVYITAEPLTKENSYFEVEILDTGAKGAIAVGLVPHNYPLDRQPGWSWDSVAYHADDGRLFKSNPGGRPFGPRCQAGDRVGCGVRFEHAQPAPNARARLMAPVFFTRNGKEVGTVLAPVPVRGLHPAVGLHSEGEEVRLNLSATWGHPQVILMSIDNYEEEWARLHDVRINGQMLEYTGRGKSIVDVGLAQSRLALDTTNHYFEMEIIDPGENCYVAIGLASRSYPKHRHPGWNKGSIAYHADDGKIFIGSGVGDAFGPRCSKGDLMGCGIIFPKDYNSEADSDGSHDLGDSDDGGNEDYVDLDDGLGDNYHSSDSEDEDWYNGHVGNGGTNIQVFFTRNGKIIGRRDIRIPRGGFYPTVGMLSSDEKVRVDLRPLTG